MGQNIICEISECLAMKHEKSPMLDIYYILNSFSVTDIEDVIPISCLTQTSSFDCMIRKILIV